MEIPLDELEERRGHRLPASCNDSLQGRGFSARAGSLQQVFAPMSLLSQERTRRGAFRHRGEHAQSTVAFGALNNPTSNVRRRSSGPINARRSCDERAAEQAFPMSNRQRTRSRSANQPAKRPVDGYKPMRPGRVADTANGFGDDAQLCTTRRSRFCCKRTCVETLRRGVIDSMRGERETRTLRSLTTMKRVLALLLVASCAETEYFYRPAAPTFQPQGAWAVDGALNVTVTPTSRIVRDGEEVGFAAAEGDWLYALICDSPKVLSQAGVELVVLHVHGDRLEGFSQPRFPSGFAAERDRSTGAGLTGAYRVVDKKHTTISLAAHGDHFSYSRENEGVSRTDGQAFVVADGKLASPIAAVREGLLVSGNVWTEGTDINTTETTGSTYSAGDTTIRTTTAQDYSYQAGYTIYALHREGDGLRGWSLVGSNRSDQQSKTVRPAEWHRTSAAAP